MADEPGNPNFEEYPVTVTLHFRTPAQRQIFMGGLSDGFGEEWCDLNWPWKAGGQFHEQARFAVENPNQTYAEEE